jgi:hypothetical protein
METYPIVAFNNTANFSDVEEFNKVLYSLLDSLRNRASSGNSTHKFAFQSVPFPNYFQTIYALLECTPDLSKTDCNNCLWQVQKIVPQCCYENVGGRFVSPSCDLRFELYPFYHASAEPPPPPLSLVPPASPPPILLPPTTQGMHL